MRLVLIIVGLHLSVLGLGAIMLLIFLRDERRFRASEGGDAPPGGEPPEDPPPARPRQPSPGGLGLPLGWAARASVRLRGHVVPRWPRPIQPRRGEPEPHRAPEREPARSRRRLSHSRRAP